MLRRSTKDSSDIEQFETYVQVKRISKYSGRESGCRKEFLAQGVIARKRIFRVGGGTLERQIDDVLDAGARSRLEGIPVQPRALAWLRKARDHQRGGHAGEGAIQRRWFGEVAVNNLCVH